MEQKVKVSWKFSIGYTGGEVDTFGVKWIGLRIWTDFVNYSFNVSSMFSSSDNFLNYPR